MNDSEKSGKGISELIGYDLSEIINQNGEEFSDGEILDQIIEYLKKYNLYTYIEDDSTRNNKNRGRLQSFTN